MLEPDHFGFTPVSAPVTSPPPAPTVASAPPPPRISTPVETPAATAEPIPLAELEKRHILAVMEKTPSRTQAAKLLGISIRTLRNKLNEYGVKSKEEENPAESEEQEGR
jgi:DNA-binding NtrC family response regulator